MPLKLTGRSPCLLCRYGLPWITATKRTGNGTSELIRAFDPTAEETLFTGEQRKRRVSFSVPG